MLIEKIYKEIYSKMQEDTGADDLSMSDRLSVLLETPIEELDKERLELLLCSSLLIFLVLSNNCTLTVFPPLYLSGFTVSSLFSYKEELI